MPITRARRAELESQFERLTGRLYAAHTKLEAARRKGIGTEDAAQAHENARRELADWCRQHADEIEQLHNAGLDEAERLNNRIATLRTLRDTWKSEGKIAHARMADERLRMAVRAARASQGLQAVAV